MVVRDAKGHFVKGAIGNPNGRPKNSDSIRAMMREKIDFEVVLDRIYEGIKVGNMDCMKLALEYGFGKPTQYIESKNETIVKSPMAEAIEQIMSNNETKQQTN